MGLFSNIVENIRDITSSISDTAFNFIGNVTDLFRPSIATTERQVEILNYGSYDAQGTLYDDYIEWIRTVDT